MQTMLALVRLPELDPERPPTSRSIEGLAVRWGSSSAITKLLAAFPDLLAFTLRMGNAGLVGQCQDFEGLPVEGEFFVNPPSTSF